MDVETSAVQANSPSTGEKYQPQFQTHTNDSLRVPAPQYRHAMPSAPWPWMDFNVDPSEVRSPPPGLPSDSGWSEYPQKLFGNWTCDQVGLSDDGCFDQQVEQRTVRNEDATNLQAFWNYLWNPPPSNIRVQAFFIEDMSLPVLQMLGTRYNIEPFFFASSANWIPSRYQEDPKALEDHITVVLPFLRILKKQRPIVRAKPMKIPTFMPPGAQPPEKQERLPSNERQTMDTQVPLALPGNKYLIQDLLSLHMIRNMTTNTIISYHTNFPYQGTSARRLQSLVKRTGDSVYWTKIFKKSKDPTFLFLAMLWYALYAWDEAFEVLYRYITDLEQDVLRSREITQELHKLQANLLYYQQLLRDFRRSVEFVRNTPNPAMNAHSISEEEREDSVKTLRLEADSLISEISRLSRHRQMMSNRLDNVIHLAFATVNIEESKNMRDLAEISLQDAGAMKELAFRWSFFQHCFWLMNVREINPMNGSSPPVVVPTSLANYIEASVALTVLTSWVAVALQKESRFFGPDSGVLHRTLWPICYTYECILKWWQQSGEHRPPPESHSYTESTFKEAEESAGRG